MELTHWGLSRERGNSGYGNDVGEGLAHYGLNFAMLIKAPQACAKCIACTCVIAPAVAEVPIAPIVGLFEGVASALLAARTLSNSAFAKAKLAHAING